MRGQDERGLGSAAGPSRAGLTGPRAKILIDSLCGPPQA
jgi:hypothetical protein